MEPHKSSLRIYKVFLSYVHLMKCFFTLFDVWFLSWENLLWVKQGNLHVYCGHTLDSGFRISSYMATNSIKGEITPPWDLPHRWNCEEVIWKVWNVLWTHILMILNSELGLISPYMYLSLAPSNIHLNELYVVLQMGHDRMKADNFPSLWHFSCLRLWHLTGPNGRTDVTS